MFLADYLVVVRWQITRHAFTALAGDPRASRLQDVAGHSGRQGPGTRWHSVTPKQSGVKLSPEKHLANVGGLYRDFMRDFATLRLLGISCC